MSRFLVDKYQCLEAYVPGEQPQDMEYVKLNTNESPYPPSPEVLDSISRAEIEKLRLYSDPDCAALRKSAAEAYGVSAANVMFSNGSDDILNFAFMAFAGGEKKAFFPDISYGFYRVLADLNKIDYTTVALREDFTIDVSDYIGLDGLIVIANPNAPTGIALPKSEIERIVKGNPNNVVLVDEAYIDFGGESCADLIDKYENLLVVMTFSKSRSLAGARLGFALANEAIIADLNRIRYSTNPYSVNRMTTACGTAAFKSSAYYREQCERIKKTREYTVSQLINRGFRVLPSSANFVFAESERVSGETLYLELKKRGVLVRHFTQPRTANFNRITIGTDEQMNVLLNAIDDIIE